MPTPRITTGYDKGKAAAGRRPWFISIDRRKRYFPSEELRDRAFQKEVALQELGVGHVQATARDEMQLREMIRLAEEKGVESLISVFRAGLERMPKKDMTLKVAADEFRAFKRAQVAARALKPNSMKQQLGALAALMRRFGEGRVHDLRNPDFKEWFMSRPHGPYGRWSAAKALGVFLNWLVKRKYLASSPLKELDIPQPTPKRLAFSYQQARVVLAIAVVEFPELTPLMGVEWLGTVRPETAAQLDYSDFIRDEKAIRLRAGKHAQGDVEFVEDFHDVLWKWIPRKKSGPIAPRNLEHRLTAFHKRLGFSKENPWPQDVARRTAISHLISLTGSLERGAKAALHSSPATTLRHYRRRFPKAEAKLYHQMTPAYLTAWHKKNRRNLPRLIQALSSPLQSEV